MNPISLKATDDDLDKDAKFVINNPDDLMYFYKGELYKYNLDTKEKEAIF